MHLSLKRRLIFLFRSLFSIHICYFFGVFELSLSQVIPQLSFYKCQMTSNQNLEILGEKKLNFQNL